MYPYQKNRHFRERTVDLTLEDTAERLQVHSPGELASLLDRLEDLMRVLGYPDRDLYAVQLSLLEAVSNAFRHGHQGDRSKHIGIRYAVSENAVMLEVEDQGPGFDPDQVPSPFTDENKGRPYGRGLFLMRAYMSWVSFNRAGNQVTLFKQRSVS
jgi:serine/threonine-protein kinase RsbW